MNNMYDFQASNDTNVDQFGMNLDVDNFDDCIFPVIQEPVTRKGKTVPNKFWVVRTDTDEIIDIVTKRFKLVTNEQIFNSFEKALRGSNLNLEGMQRKCQLSGNGKITFINYRLPAQRVEVLPGDVQILDIRAKNGYDGHTSFNAYAEAYRLACGNMMEWEREKALIVKASHTPNLDLEKIQLRLQNVLGNFKHQEKIWSEWARTRLTMVKAMKLLMNNMGQNAANKHIERFEIESEKLGFTLWSLYNALTHWSTHAKISAGSDLNEAKIRQERKGKVYEVIKSKSWQDLIHAA